MLWYNKETGALQSVCPAGSVASAAYMKENYPEWEQVEDSFVPPVVEKEQTKEEKLQEIETQYATLLEGYKNNLLTLTLLGRDTTKIKERYQAVFKEYTAAKKEVMA